MAATVSRSMPGNKSPVEFDPYLKGGGTCLTGLASSTSALGEILFGKALTVKPRGIEPFRYTSNVSLTTSRVMLQPCACSESSYRIHSQNLAQKNLRS